MTTKKPTMAEAVAGGRVIAQCAREAALLLAASIADRMPIHVQNRSTMVAVIYAAKLIFDAAAKQPTRESFLTACGNVWDAVESGQVQGSAGVNTAGGDA